MNAELRKELQPVVRIVAAAALFVPLIYFGAPHALAAPYFWAYPSGNSAPAWMKDALLIYFTPVYYIQGRSATYRWYLEKEASAVQAITKTP